jgi:hypothetical protein
MISVVKMEAVCSSETLISFCKSTQRYSPQDRHGLYGTIILSENHQFPWIKKDVEMKLALVIASLIAVGFASSDAYVLKQGLAPEEYNFVLIPVQEETLQEDGSVEVPSLNEEDTYSEARGILMVRKLLFSTYNPNITISLTSTEI